MKLTLHHEVLYDRIDRAIEQAFDDWHAEAQAEAPRLTGEYAASLELTRTGKHAAAIGSSLPQAWAIEKGANVGDRRGPHHGPVGTLADVGPRIIEHMRDAL